jgi:hypothetical protein
MRRETARASKPGAGPDKTESELFEMNSFATARVFRLWRGL